MADHCYIIIIVVADISIINSKQLYCCWRNKSKICNELA